MPRDLTDEERESLFNPCKHLVELLPGGEPETADGARQALLEIAHLLARNMPLPGPARSYLSGAFLKIVLWSISPARALGLPRNKIGRPAGDLTSSNLQALMRERRYLQRFLEEVSQLDFDFGDRYEPRPQEVVNLAIEKAAKSFGLKSERPVRDAVKRHAPTFLDLKSYLEFTGSESYGELVKDLVEVYGS